MLGGALQKFSMKSRGLSDKASVLYKEFFSPPFNWDFSNDSDLSSAEIAVKHILLRGITTISEKLVELLQNPPDSDDLYKQLETLVLELDKYTQFYRAISKHFTLGHLGKELDLLYFLQSILGYAELGIDVSPVFDKQQWSQSNFVLSETSFQGFLIMLRYAICSHATFSSNADSLISRFFVCAFTYYGKEQFLRAPFEMSKNSFFPSRAYSSGQQFIDAASPQTTESIKLECAQLLRSLLKLVVDPLTSRLNFANTYAKQALCPNPVLFHGKASIALIDETLSFEQLQMLFRGSEEQFQSIMHQNHYEIREFKGAISKHQQQQKQQRRLAMYPSAMNGHLGDIDQVQQPSSQENMSVQSPKRTHSTLSELKNDKLENAEVSPPVSQSKKPKTPEKEESFYTVTQAEKSDVLQGNQMDTHMVGPVENGKEENDKKLKRNTNETSVDKTMKVVEGEKVEKTPTKKSTPKKSVQKTDDFSHGLFVDETDSSLSDRESEKIQNQSSRIEKSAPSVASEPRKKKARKLTEFHSSAVRLQPDSDFLDDEEGESIEGQLTQGTLVAATQRIESSPSTTKTPKNVQIDQLDEDMVGTPSSQKEQSKKAISVSSPSTRSKDDKNMQGAVAALKELPTPSSASKGKKNPYSQEEVQWLVDGLSKYPNQWTKILSTYPFKHRSAVDLKDKARNMKKYGML